MPIDFQTFANFGRANGMRIGVLGWPKWARTALLVPMVPGILMLALCLVGILVSLLALFVLTAPVYLLLAKLFTERKLDDFQGDPDRSPRSKRVEAVVRDV